jgi:hypothetical protein
MLGYIYADTWQHFHFTFIFGYTRAVVKLDLVKLPKIAIIKKFGIIQFLIQSIFLFSLSSDKI